MKFIKTGRSFLNTLCQTKKRYHRILIASFIVLCLFTAYVTSLPMVILPLKPAPATGPYQDTEFFDIANDTIYSLSGQTIPNGTELRELQTTQQQLTQMNISPDFYPTATKINDYLYYVSKAGDEASDAMNLADKMGSPEYTDWTVDSKAKAYQEASFTVWEDIKELFPNVTPYELRPVATRLPSDKIVTQWPKSPFSVYDFDD